MILRPDDEPTHVLGVDLGFHPDYTALALLACHGARGTGTATYEIRHLERVRDREYPQVLLRLADVLEAPELATGCELVVDMTGVGIGPVQFMRQAGLRPVGVTITGGAEAAMQPTGDWRVPKSDLIYATKVLLGTGRLKSISPRQSQVAGVLAEELQRFSRQITKAGNETFGEWRSGKHDDLVLATALACWYAENQGPIGFWAV
jgi:hypothetical protein